MSISTNGHLLPRGQNSSFCLGDGDVHVSAPGSTVGSEFRHSEQTKLDSFRNVCLFCDATVGPV